MDQIFDRLGNLLRSLFQEEDPPSSARTRRSSLDPDMDAAWEELDEFLKTGKESSSGQRASTGSSSRAGSRASAGSEIPEEVRRDYANLGVPVSADLATVRKAYHNLIRKYHPDRFAHDPQKLKDATEITQKINQSYQRIKKYRETGRI